MDEQYHKPERGFAGGYFIEAVAMDPFSIAALQGRWRNPGGGGGGEAIAPHPLKNRKMPIFELYTLTVNLLYCCLRTVYGGFYVSFSFNSA